jgi:ribosome biogenesis GTPase / thiamine phosphate phosphatase
MGADDEETISGKDRPHRWMRCDVEEHYFGEERKVSKKERKLATSKDRSKYKKTDREKLQKQAESIQSSKLLNKDFLEGRVVSIVPEGIIVDYDKHFITCALRGILKKDKSRFKNLVTVGDKVLFQLKGENEASIVHVLPRYSTLSRADNLSRRKEQLIAANIDQVLITLSVVSPPLKLGLADRYIIAARKGGMEPVVVINKIDLLDTTDVDNPLIAKEKEIFDDIVKAYKDAGISVIPMSMVTGEGLDLLKEVMKNKASVFSGQSGVGKTSLINTITGLNLLTRDVVGKTQKGAHTTTTTKLLPLEFGGWCIDTPGIKSFGLWDLSKDEVEHYFSEIYEIGRSCRYPDCAHIHEAECAVQKAVEENKISFLRYNSYLSLLESVSKDHVRR